MNETMNPVSAGTTETKEFVWRRLAEPLRLANLELDGQIWLFVLGAVLAIAFFYVIFMYRKDARGVGIWWASLLGLLRLSVYAILALVFLLPSEQTLFETQTQGKVIVLIDVSDSMQTSDEPPNPNPLVKRITRMEQLRERVLNTKIPFLTDLEKKNPTTLLRLAKKLDVEYILLDNGRVYTKEDKDKPLRDEVTGKVILPKEPLTDVFLTGFTTPSFMSDAAQVPQAPDEENKRRYKSLVKANEELLQGGKTKGTNIGDSLLSLINREQNNRVQGIILITEGRQNEGSMSTFREAEVKLKNARIPLFIIGVGEERQRVKIEIGDLRLPPGPLSPEDQFRGKIDVTGIGLSGAKVDSWLELVHVEKVKIKKEIEKDGKKVTVLEEIERILPIEIIEAEDPKSPKSKRETIPLFNPKPRPIKELMQEKAIPTGPTGKEGKLEKPAKPVDAKTLAAEEKLRLRIQPDKQLIFDKAATPRANGDFTLGVKELAKAAGLDLEDVRFKGKKWELAETKENSELRFQFMVPVDKREGLDKKEHRSDIIGLTVQKKPLRVLLFASAATRDYQFLRTFLVREFEKKRVELAIHLQLPPGEIKQRPGIVQDVPPDRLLGEFPDSLDTKKDIYDLSSYDVIVCFDPDWTRLRTEQIRLLRRWTDKGGGIIYLGGHFNTVRLAFPPEDQEPKKFDPLIEVLPVVLGDRREYLSRKTDTPFTLDLSKASPDLEFVRLDEGTSDKEFLKDWDDFFFGTGPDKTKDPQRGFYNFYPVKSVRTGSVVVARYNDPSVKIKQDREEVLHPFIVLPPDLLARVIWIGSTETWRLREYREAFHERFWTKLLRYAAAKSKGGFSKWISLEMARNYVTSRPVEVEARIDTPDGKSYPKDAKPPEITLKMPPGVSEKEIPQPIIMSPRVGPQEGWFTARFEVRSAGPYELSVRVPELINPKAFRYSDPQKFNVKESNPELDDTRPDVPRMYRLASEFEEIRPRLNETDANEIKKQLKRPKISTEEVSSKEGDLAEALGEDKPRLYFNLQNAEWIPRCINSDVQSQAIKGAVRDLWDDGFVIYEYPAPNDPNETRKAPVKISYVLLLAVLLLSTEWLIRKLLRLA